MLESDRCVFDGEGRVRKLSDVLLTMSHLLRGISRLFGGGGFLFSTTAGRCGIFAIRMLRVRGIWSICSVQGKKFEKFIQGKSISIAHKYNNNNNKCKQTTTKTQRGQWKVCACEREREWENLPTESWLLPAFFWCVELFKSCRLFAGTPPVIGPIVVVSLESSFVPSDSLFRSGFVSFWSSSSLTAAIDVIDDLENRRSASLNLRFRLSAFELVVLFVVKYRSHPRIMLPYSCVSSR